MNFYSVLISFMIAKLNNKLIKYYWHENMITLCTVRTQHLKPGPVLDFLLTGILGIWPMRSRKKMDNCKQIYWIEWHIWSYFLPGIATKISNLFNIIIDLTIQGWSIVFEELAQVGERKQVLASHNDNQIVILY